MRGAFRNTLQAAAAFAFLLGGSSTVLAAEDSGPIALHELFDREWSRCQQEDPLSASKRGEYQYNDRWPDVSLAALAASHAADVKALAELGRIDRRSLPTEEQISYDVFQWEYQDRLLAWRLHEYVFPMNQIDGIPVAGDNTLKLRFATLQDYQDWLKRLRSFGLYMDQNIALLQQGVTENRVLPQVIAAQIPPRITANLQEDITKSPFYTPFLKMPSSIDAATAQRLQADGHDAISRVVIPAYQRLQSFFSRTYLPHTRASLGTWALPQGKESYEYLAHHFTTTQLEPGEIHVLGLKRMADIRSQMLDVMKHAGFQGSLQEFLQAMRSDPKFYYTNGADLLKAYRAEGKIIDPLLVNEFGHLPRAPWGIRPIPDDQAPNMYPVYAEAPSADGSRAAYMYVNLYRPETRPTYEIPAYTCHEGRPGHTLQMALAVERTDLPNFRRFAYYSAFGEGWAVYTEVLCGEMGLYQDPYEQFGALSLQMFRAARLVVDTGIHSQGMTREEAIEVLRENTALSERTIGTEVDRYIGWPGQALSYAIGEIKIQELRERAQKALGSRFDIKQFHDVILQGGALPLNVLETVVDRWIKTESGTDVRTLN
jgi:uncharacterized protein (DUF885 family)